MPRGSTLRRERVVLAGPDLGGDPVAISFTPDGRLLDVLLTSLQDDATAWRLVQIDPASGARRDTGIHRALVGGGAARAHISDDGTTALLWTTTGSAPPTLIDLRTGQQATLRPAARPDVVFGYRALRSGAVQLWADGTLTFYDMEGRAAAQIDVPQLEVHDGAVSDVVLAPDGTWAGTVGNGPAVVLWKINRTSGEWTVRESLTGHGGDIWEAELDPAGGRLVTLALGGRGIVWDVGPGPGGAGEPSAPSALLRDACALVDRDLTHAEWERYVPGRTWRATCSDLD
jgi:hypothetical protein